MPPAFPWGNMAHLMPTDRIGQASQPGPDIRVSPHNKSHANQQGGELYNPLGEGRTADIGGGGGEKTKNTRGKVAGGIATKFKENT
jgi:hypothetical protein